MFSQRKRRILLIVSFAWFARTAACFTLVKSKRAARGLGRSSALSSLSDSFDTKIVPETPHLTVLLPAYNEVDRIGETIDTYQSYLANSNRWKDKSEILVVDDGSDDGTAEFVLDRNNEKVDCIRLVHNKGKGAAIAFGVQHILSQASGEARLMLVADADGSADICSLERMVETMKQLIATGGSNSTSSSFWNTPAIVVGNRGYQASSISRSILRWGFRTTVKVLCGDLRVGDTQCGFKLFTLTAAKELYNNLYIVRWSHDVEVLFRARVRKMPIAEEPVPWQDKEGSKLVTSTFAAVEASLTMLLEVLRMRLCYEMGLVSFPSETNSTK